MEGGRPKEEMERHLPFVRKLATRIHNAVSPPLGIEDLVSYGVIGLADAMRQFRPETGVPLESFAHYRVRGAILEGISRQCPVSRHVHRRLRLIEKANDCLEGTAADLAGARERTQSGDASMIAATVRDLAAVYGLTRIAYRRGEDGQGLEFVDGTAEEAHEEAVESGELRTMIDRLPPDQAKVLKLYYFADMTLDEIGVELGCKKSWACKLHKAALKGVRSMIEKDREGAGAEGPG